MGRGRTLGAIIESDLEPKFKIGGGADGYFTNHNVLANALSSKNLRMFVTKI